MASKPICQSRCCRAAIALLMVCCIESLSRSCSALSCLAERKANWAFTICSSAISLLTACLFSLEAFFSFLSICSRMSATLFATFTGEMVSMMARLLSFLTLRVSACSFLKASARRRKKPFLVFITSTVVVLASCVWAVLEWTTTESFPVLRLCNFSCK